LSGSEPAILILNWRNTGSDNECDAAMSVYAVQRTAGRGDRHSKWINFCRPMTRDARTDLGKRARLLAPSRCGSANMASSRRAVNKGTVQVCSIY
jgi:hypothetical protein